MLQKKVEKDTCICKIDHICGKEVFVGLEDIV